MTPPENLIEDGKRLVALCGDLARAGSVAVDTEFHGERRFWPELFLVQVADGEGAWVIDPLAVPDLGPFAALMADESVTKIMHSARNDVSVLRRALGTEFRNVFDTQLAAAFLGYGEQCSLNNLLQEACGIKAGKAFGLSDWSRRPLAEEQLEYALDDVRYLVRLHGKLHADLVRRRRLEWYRLEAEAIVRPDSYEVSTEEVYRRARSAGKLKRNSLPVLWRLVAWREGRARELDRPRAHIASDSLLARLALMSPRSMDSLERLRGVPSGFAGRWGAEVLEVVRDAVENPPGDLPQIPTRKSDGTAAARADILRIFVKQKAHQLRIAPSLLLPRDTLEGLAALKPSDIPSALAAGAITGWRMEVLGDEIVSLLTGRLALSLGSSPSGGLRFVRVD